MVMRIFTILSCSSKGLCHIWGLSHTKQGSGSQTSSWSSMEPSKYLFTSFQVFVYIFPSICLHLSEYLFTFFQVFVYIFLVCFKTYLDIECFTVWGFLEHLRKRHCVLHNEVLHTKSWVIKIFLPGATWCWTAKVTCISSPLTRPCATSTSRASSTPRTRCSSSGILQLHNNQYMINI